MNPSVLSSLGASLVEALPRLYGVDPDPLVAEVISALTRALERGELELPLQGPPPDGIGADSIAAGHWPEGHRAALERSGLVGESPAPMVWTAAGGVGWLRWQRQLEAVMRALQQRAASPLDPPLEPGLRQRLVAEAAQRGGLDPLQQQAVAALLSHRLVLLGGGPGTGKTTTVVQMLAAALVARPDLRIHLAAPTGKAATRLRRAFDERSTTIPGGLASRCAELPCSTLHRLLESHGDGFGRNLRHRLALDLLVVDEVSMLDLPLMAALLEALPDPAQLVLIGDPAQLPPVGPGAVLAELERAPRRAALGDGAIRLATTYRNEGAIAAVAACLRRGDGAGLEQALATLAPGDNLRWLRAEPPRLPAELLERMRQHQQALQTLAAEFDPANPHSGVALLAQLEDCVLLSPVRRGAWGVERLHQRLLGEALERGPGNWPAGTPVLCSRNLPEQQLANGDVGVVVHLASGETMLLFPGEGCSPRLIHPARLIGTDPALALTIHKAQGSQYRQVLTVLPPSDRWDGRLLYTALTRARQQAWLIAGPYLMNSIS